jgi:hypothetical protein
MILVETFLLGAAAALGGAAPADGILAGGVVHTLDPGMPRAEAIAWRGGRIIAVGRSDEVLGTHRGPSTRVIDLAGRCAVPGLIDAHAHFLFLGDTRRRLDLSGTRSFDEAVALVRERAARSPPGAWLIGGRWDQSLWGEKELPSHGKLSAAVPDRPVLLFRVDGHAALVNRKAMDLAGIGARTADPPGGEVLRDGRGEPTGILVDGAIGLATRIAPPRSGSIEELAREAQGACLRAGLTGIHDMGVSEEEAEELERLAAAGVLKIRLYLALGGGQGLARTFAARKPRTGERVSLRAGKMCLDGALGSRGAWLLEPYADRPADARGKPYTGLATEDPAAVRAAAAAALRNGWQLCVHAIGDRANRECLDAFEAAIRETGVRDGRLRIEHAQCVSPADIPRFARLGVIPSMQPSHATTDMRWVEDRLGKARLAGCYAWRSFLDTGCRIAGGSDFPVEDERPLLGFWAAATRKDREGRPAGGWMPGQRMIREEALRAFTIDAAWSAFEEREKGSIEAGKLADITVLSRDILAVPEEDILGTEVDLTIVGGELVFARLPPP